MMRRSTKIKIIAVAAILATCMIGVWAVTRAEDTTRVTVDTTDTTDTIDPTVDTTEIAEVTEVTQTVSSSLAKVSTTPEPIKPVQAKPTTEEGKYQNERNAESTNNTIADTVSDTEYLNAVGDVGTGVPTEDVEANGTTDESDDGTSESDAGDSGAVETVEQDYVDDVEDIAEPEMTEETAEEVVEEVYQEPEGAQEESTDAGWVYYSTCHITHYCGCPICTGPWYGSATASGAWPQAFYTVATGSDIPFGTEIMINGQVYVVQDRGVGNGAVDIYVGDHQLALDMGEYWADVYVKW